MVTPLIGLHRNCLGGVRPQAARRIPSSASPSSLGGSKTHFALKEGPVVFPQGPFQFFKRTQRPARPSSSRYRTQGLAASQFFSCVTDGRPCALTRAIPAHEAEPARSTNAWYTQLVQPSRVLSPAAARKQLFLPPADFAFARGLSSALGELAHWQSGLSQREKPPGQWADPTNLDG